MRKIKIIANEVFQTVVPLCTISTIKEGESGFIRKDDCVFYAKIGSKNQYLRIKINAPIYSNQDGVFMIHVCKVENRIEVEADSEAFYYLEIGFNENPELFTAETKIEYEDYLPYDTDEAEEPKNRVNEILFESETLQDAHRHFINYCYSSDADEQGMNRVANLLPGDIEIMFATSKLSVLYMFLEETITNIEDLNDRKEVLLSNKNNIYNGFDPDVEIPNYRILGKYLKKIESLLDTAIAEKIGEDQINKDDLSKLDIDTLVSRIEQAKTQDEKNRLNDEIQKKVHQQQSFSSAKRGSG